MIVLAIWEIVMLVGVTALAIWSWRRSSLALYGLLVIYLVTQLFWHVLTGGHEINNRGHHWFTDPWNPLFSWLPAMKWWMWLLTILAIAGFVAARFVHQAAGVFARVCTAMLLALALFGADWTDPFTGSPAAAKSPKSISANAQDCPTLLQSFSDAQKALTGPIVDSNTARIYTIRALQYKQAIMDKKCLSGIRVPMANFTVSATSADMTVQFDASGSAPQSGLTYGWNWGDINQADTEYGGPTKTHLYSLPGSYFPRLQVTDVYGRSATYQLPEAVIVPMEQTASN